MEALVGNQTGRVERALLRRVPHGTTRLRQMPAVVEAALIEEPAELGKADRQELRVNAPGADLTQPGGVHDVAAAREGHHERRACRVLTRVPFRADLTDTEVQPWVEGVEEARFPDARLTREYRFPTAQQVAERRQAFRQPDRRGQDLIPRRRIPLQ